MILTYTVKGNNKTINQLIKEKYDISNRLFSKLIKNKKIFLNSTNTDTRNIANIGDIITINLDYEEDNSNIIPIQMKLDIIFEDDGLLILNKPAGIASHPSMLHFDDTLSNGVRFYFDSINLHKKIRPVNRLDLNTSGLIIFAKNEYIQECLIKQMSNGSFKKEYLCLVKGNLSHKKGMIDAPIARKKDSIIERCVDLNGKLAITEFKVLKSYDNYSLVKCILHTGRTHQIRVHMAYIGHPLIGDTLYGDNEYNLNRHALHCYKISFIHPVSHKQMIFKSKNFGDFYPNKKTIPNY